MDEQREGVVGIAARWAATPPPADAEALRNLVQAYAFFTDAGEAARLAELFTADASWDGTHLGYGTASGAEAIAALVTGRYRSDEPMVHLPGPPLLVARSATEAEGVSWCLATRWSGGGSRPIIYFSYEDEFVRGDDGRWRFRRRLLRATFPGAGP